MLEEKQNMNNNSNSLLTLELAFLISDFNEFGVGSHIQHMFNNSVMSSSKDMFSK